MTNDKYLNSISLLKIGGTCYVSCRDWPSDKAKVVDVKEHYIEVDVKGNDHSNMIFSKVDK